MSEPTAIKIESAIAAHLTSLPALSGLAIIGRTDLAEAPEHPSALVHCQKISRMPDTALSMYCKVANVTVVLYYDADDDIADPPIFSAYARELECAMEDLAAMQSVFNYAGEPDNRTVSGLHLHYIDELQTDNDTDDMTWQFGVGLTLHIEEVDQ